MLHTSRNIQFFGLESQKIVTSSYVVVIGLGGVGSHAASMLMRSGVGRLLLVDFDQVGFLVWHSFHKLIGLQRASFWARYGLRSYLT